MLGGVGAIEQAVASTLLAIFLQTTPKPNFFLA